MREIMRNRCVNLAIFQNEGATSLIDNKVNSHLETVVYDQKDWTRAQFMSVTVTIIYIRVLQTLYSISVTLKVLFGIS